MASASLPRWATVFSAEGRPGRCSRDRDSQVMIDSYKSARCSGNRRSFQCTTASAVSITGLRTISRISGRSAMACSSSSRCWLAAAVCSGYNASHQRDRNSVTASSDSGSMRAWAKFGQHDAFGVRRRPAGDDEPAAVVLLGGVFDQLGQRLPGLAVGRFVQAVQQHGATAGLQRLLKKRLVQVPGVVVAADIGQMVRQPGGRRRMRGRTERVGTSLHAAVQVGQADEDRQGTVGKRLAEWVGRGPFRRRSERGTTKRPRAAGRSSCRNRDRRRSPAGTGEAFAAAGRCPAIHVGRSLRDRHSRLGQTRPRGDRTRSSTRCTAGRSETSVPGPCRPEVRGWRSCRFLSADRPGTGGGARRCWPA